LLLYILLARELVLLLRLIVLLLKLFTGLRLGPAVEEELLGGLFCWVLLVPNLEEKKLGFNAPLGVLVATGPRGFWVVEMGEGLLRLEG
jgi:hypothetical protein